MTGFADGAGSPDLTEIATSRDGRDITRPFFGPLIHPQDTVLASLGQRWEAYREIRRDGQVHATFQQRRLAIVGRPLVVEPGRDDVISKAAAEQLQANLDDIAFDRATKGMSWGFFYGFSVGECMWSIRDNRVWLDQVKVRTPWRFRFTDAGELRLLTRTNTFQGEQLPERKFWIMSSGADNDDEPYGLGLAHQLYWPVYFKKQGLAFWLRALEKFGAPTAVGTYPAGSDADTIQKLLAAAIAIRIDGAVVKPEGTVLELLEATRGTVDQATFLRQMNAEVSKIVIGQTMTTDDGSSLAQGKVHQDVKEEVTDADVEELCESFQQGPARWLTEWNFPGAAIPILKRPSPEDEERAAELRKKDADTLKTMDDAGYEPDEDMAGARYPGWRRKPAPEPPPTPPAPAPPNLAPAAPVQAAFAEADRSRDAIDAYLELVDWEAAMEPVARSIEDLVLASPSLEAAAQRLVGLFTGDAGAALTEQLARALLQAGLAGQGGLALSDREDRAQAAD
jgi:phage gp29-like protein